MDGDLLKVEMQKKWDALGLNSAGLMRRPEFRTKYADFDGEFWPFYDACHAYSMSSVERLYDLYKSVEYVVKAGIPGDIVECGVWKGANMMLVAQVLQHLGDLSRGLWLYDTYEGLPYPDPEIDLDILGQSAAERWREGWIKEPLEAVTANMQEANYPHVSYVKGMVEDTLLTQVPAQIAIARLDTDWYESTKVELEVLWPKIAVGGILICDDFGHWLGARKATEEYFADKPVKMHRIDYSARTIQKVA